MEPIFRGLVDVSLVQGNPNNRDLIPARVQALEQSMENIVMDKQHPIILSTEVRSELKSPFIYLLYISLPQKYFLT
jgi:hypothetical protein